MIRFFQPDDYIQVWHLLNNNGVEPPHEPSDLNGLGLVAEENGQIVGFIWALVSNSTQAYVDYYVTDYKTNSQNGIRANRVGLELVRELEILLIELGVKRYTFYVEIYNPEFVEMAKRLGAEELRDLTFMRKEISK